MTAYAAPTSVGDVVRLLSDHGEQSKVLAGGQSLLVLLRQDLISPDLLVSLRLVNELRDISRSRAEGVDIGAAVTQARLETDQNLLTHYTALAEAASVVATRQVRTLGTLGGNLCHADPTADPPAALIALGAQLEALGPRGRRRLPVEAFFKDFMEVDLAPDELLTHILLPPPTSRSGSAYLKYRQREVDTALIGVAVWLRVSESGDRIRDARIGLAAAGPTPLRSLAAEEVLRGAPATRESLMRAAEAAAATCEPLSDTEATDWYRRQMVRVFLERAGERALERARSA
jgi:aerobic carbon-monoxide dehydrogenase medium subunit